MNISQLPARPLAGDLKSCLPQLLNRGDRVEVQAGKLVITPKSGQPVPPNWLRANENNLLSDITHLINKPAFSYQGFTRGRYGRFKKPGVTLQFINIKSGEEAFAIFNVSITRERSSAGGKKAGDELPAKQFKPPKGGEFIKFWHRAGLINHGRAKLCRYMGNLGTVIYTALPAPIETIGNKLMNSSITPISISYEQINQVLSMPTSCPNHA